jgi:hypothetical protein
MSYAEPITSHPATEAPRVKLDWDAALATSPARFFNR